MKKFLFVGIAVVSASLAYADGDRITVKDCGVSVTNSSYTTYMNGWLDAVHIVLGTTYTGTVTVTRPGKETVLTASAISSTNQIYRPRVPAQDADGVAIGGGTNAFEKFYLYGERVLTTVTSVGNTSDVQVMFIVIPPK